MLKKNWKNLQPILNPDDEDTIEEVYPGIHSKDLEGLEVTYYIIQTNLKHYKK